jgi:hypothetical protein
MKAEEFHSDLRSETQDFAKHLQTVSLASINVESLILIIYHLTNSAVTYDNFWKKMPDRTYISKEGKSKPGFKAAKD